jgi:CBS domain-containing protein
MGIFSGIVGFGLGYAAGMRVGDRPIRSLQRTADDARARARSISDAADRVRSRMSGAGARTVDVRQVRDVMTVVPETVGATAPLRDAAAIMERADVGDVLVVEGDELLGVLTDRDIAVRAVAGGRDVSTTVARDVFTPGAVTISPTATVQEAIELMRRHDVRRLPVVEDGRPVGVVSIGDLAVSREPTSLLADITVAPPNT